ncbi:MAG: DNA polymerase I [candidate division Zixibacteria bacterium]|nr:DNA polymerase I [candidate division Zixibacteria bacterium]
MSKLLILIDGSAIAYRAYFAFIRNPLINSRGVNTGAVYGFTNSLIRLMEQIKPDYLACVFDTPAPTFRHKLYTEYKSTRAKMPDELAESLPQIREVLDGFKIPVIEKEGFEADDIIGTLAKKASGAGMEVGMFTGDKDFYQLVDDKVKLLHPKTFEWFGHDEVIKKMGVTPDRIIDLLALMGDSSDNVPGVRGVGEKTALKLLNEFGDFETVLKSAGKIARKKISKSLQDNQDTARLSYKLVTIDCQTPVKFDKKSLRLEQPDSTKLAELFKKLEFGALYKKYTVDNQESWQQTLTLTNDMTYETVGSLDKLDSILSAAERAGEAAIDTETTSTKALGAKIVGISIAFKENEAFYIPLAHDEQDKNLPFDKTLGRFGKFFNSETKLIGHNLKYDRQIFDNCSLKLKNTYFDTMIAAYLINPGRRSNKLEALADEYYQYKMQPISELIGKGKKQLLFSAVPVNKASFYAAEDADFTLKLKHKLSRLLEEHRLTELFYNLEMPLLSVLGDIEKNGVAIDFDFLRNLSTEYGDKMEVLKGDIYSEAGQEFNINSPVQLRGILFDKLQLPSSKKTAKGGEKSTDVSVLEKLAKIHPLPKLILDYRQLTKLRSTYIDAIPGLILSETGRVHTSFNQTVAATGRLSSSDPNLQNIPIRTELGREIRKAFIARKGFNILSADYSQIELRLMAHFAGDKTLLDAFGRGEDIHSRTAAEVFGAKLDDVTTDQRRAAKTANFAIIYGVSAYGLSQQAELTMAEAQDYIKAYFDRYPGVKKYMDEIKEFAREKGYVETLLKRRRYLPDIKANSRQSREFAERIAINTPIQGTAADMIKLAMIGIGNKLKNKKSLMILQVHDELVFEQKLSERSFMKKMVIDQMEGALKLKVPIKVDFGEGENWLEAH